MAKLQDTAVYGNLDVTGDIDIDGVLQSALTINGTNSQTDSLTLDGHIAFTGDGSNNPVIRTPGGGSNSFRIYDDANGQDLLRASEGGTVNIPNGSLQEQGNRVATRTWTNNNADVPNADYADNAGQLDGIDSSSFLRSDQNDTMSGILKIQGVNSVDHGPRLIVGSDDDSGQTDIGFEVRGNSAGGSVDMSDTNDSGDTRFGVLGDGTTVIGHSNLSTNGFATGGSHLLDVNGNTAVRGNLDVTGNITEGATL